MEQTNTSHSWGVNFEARIVKDIIEPAKSIFNKASVKAALDEMNRKVGGFGHDPTTEPVEAQIEKDNPYCFEDQTVAEAEQIMLNAKFAEVPVVTREKLLVGAINIEAIAQDRKRRERLEPFKYRT